jgi:hypothetical protein
MSHVLDSNWGEMSSAGGQDDLSSPTQTPPLGPSAFYSDSLDDAIRSAEKLLILSAQGSLRRGASASHHSDASTSVATILRAVSTIARTHRIPLQSCVLKRIRMLALENPLPDRLLVEVPAISGGGAPQASDRSDLTPINGLNDKTGPSLSTSQLPPTGIQGIVRAALSSGTSSGSQIPLSNPSQILEEIVLGEGPSMNASNRHASSSSFDDVRGNGTNGTGSTLHTTATGSSAPFGHRGSQKPLIHLVSRASPHSDYQSEVHQPSISSNPNVLPPQLALPLPLTSTSVPALHQQSQQQQQQQPRQLHRRPQQHNNGVSAGTRTGGGSSTNPSSISAPSNYQPHHIVSYIDEVIIGDDTPLCDSAYHNAREGSKEQDPIHAEYLRDGAWVAAAVSGSGTFPTASANNNSFVGLSPMTPADLLRQSLCDQIPGAAHSISSLKQSYRELQNHSFHSNGGGSASGGLLSHFQNSPLEGAHLGPSQVGSSGGRGQPQHQQRSSKQRLSHPAAIKPIVQVISVPPVATSLSANTSHDNLASLSQTQDSGEYTPGAAGALTTTTTIVNAVLPQARDQAQHHAQQRRARSAGSQELHIVISDENSASPTTFGATGKRRDESPQPLPPSVPAQPSVQAAGLPTFSVAAAASLASNSLATQSRAKSSSAATQYVSLTSRTIPSSGRLRVAYGLELLRQVTSEQR